VGWGEVKLKRVLWVFGSFLTVSLCVACGKRMAENFAVFDEGKWNPEARAQILKLISTVGHKNPAYNPEKPPYAVFDWDQTSIFNDSEEVLFRYMIDNILFKVSPKEFAEAIRKNVPKDNFLPSYNNKAGKPVNIGLVAADLESDYRFIYDNYIGTKKLTLEELRARAEFKDWQAKLAYLYEAINGSFNTDVGYPWILYLFAGLSEAELRELAEKSNMRGLADKIDGYSLESPAGLPGKSGVISFDGYKRGLRLVPEISNLMHVFKENGIDVYVCSASHEAIVRVFACLPKYGYSLPEENIIGMKTKMVDGKFTTEYDHTNGYPLTKQEGKVIAINQILVPKYGHGPVFVAGDSIGDFNMATEFPDTRLTLIINQLRTDDFGKLGILAYKQSGSKNPRFVMQGYDNNIGQFRPSIATIRLGESVPTLMGAKKRGAEK
jgi:phosphoserine phosphatase